MKMSKSQLLNKTAHELARLGREIKNTTKCEGDCCCPWCLVTITIGTAVCAARSAEDFERCLERIDLENN